MFQNEEFINDFIDEANSHVEKFEAYLLNVESKNYDKETINSMFRSIHSIKGTAGFLGLSKIVKLSHSMENILSDIKSEKVALNSEIFEIFLKCLDTLKSMINLGFKSEDIDIIKYVEMLDLIKTKDDNVEKLFLESIKESNKIDFKVPKFNKINEKIEIINNSIKHGKKLYKVSFIDNSNEYISFVMNELNDLGDVYIFEESHESIIYFFSVLEKSMIDMVIEKNKCELNELNISLLFEKYSNSDDDSGLENSILEEISITSSETVRVSVSLLNKLLDISSEMVLRRNQLLNQMSIYTKDIPELNELLQNIDYLTTEIQEKVMQTRLQPLNLIFNKLPRMLRDLSKQLNKESELSIKGGYLELDKSIIEELMDPFIHIVRNCIDHGIELPSDRIKKGKNRVGSISINAFHESGFVNIDIIDDGRGLSSSRIKSKAISLGYNQDFIESMSEQELIKLIFEPGFSTADTVTDISGRGVGLNVLKTNIEKLGGTIDISSKKDKGTSVRLVLPLTMAIIPSLIIGIKEYRFVIAKSNLQEVIKVDKDDVKKFNGSMFINLRKNLIPVLDLYSLLNIESNLVKEKINIIIVKYRGRRVGLIIDEIYDEEEILVKKLPRYFKDITFYSGVTVLGNGKTAMILDTESISSNANLDFGEGEQSYTMSDGIEIKKESEYLVFRSFGAEIYAIDIKNVLRVEKIEVNDIQKIGNDDFIQFQNKPLKAIYVEDFLGFEKKEASNKYIYIIATKSFEVNYCIIIEGIYETISTQISYHENLCSKYILGNIVFDSKITIIPDFKEISKSLM